MISMRVTFHLNGFIYTLITQGCSVISPHSQSTNVKMRIILIPFKIYYVGLGNQG